MSDLSLVERLAKLRALREWLAWQLRDTERKIGDLERRIVPVTGYVTEAERHAGKAVGVTVHQAGCRHIQQPVAVLDATEAQYTLLKDPSFAHACAHCRPDTALGIPDKPAE